MSGSTRRLSAAFYNRPTEQVARELLGKLLVRRAADGRRLSGIVIEVEAYLDNADPASHSHRGEGKKNASMFLAPGTLYVYPIHSRHCLNVVTERAGVGAAVLIRALEPWEGDEALAANRGLPPWSPDLRLGRSASRLTRFAWAHRLTSGPGRLCQALGVDRSLDGIDLLAQGEVWLEQMTASVSSRWMVSRSARIGISQAQDLQLRWFLDGNRFVSGRALDHRQGRTWTFREWSN